MTELGTFRFRLVGDYALDIPIQATDLVTAKNMLRREEVGEGVVTPQEMGRRFLRMEEGWAPQGVDEYMMALTDVGPDAPIFSLDYGAALIVRELPYAEGAEQTYRFSLSQDDDGETYVARVTATSLYAAIDQLLDGCHVFTTDDVEAKELEWMDDMAALFAMLTIHQDRYEEHSLSYVTVAYEIVSPN